MSLLLSGGLFAQDQKTIKETRKEASQRKKEEKKAKIENQYKITDSLLEERKFVLEAQFLKTSRGERFPVISTLNFIFVDSLSGVIQVGSVQRVGYNGVGGVTVQGRISNWKLEKDEKQKNFYLIFSIQGNIDIYDVNMNIDYAGYAYATLNGINSGKLTFEGNLVSKEETVIFKGQTW
ncbi:MAG: DUF4251 domain-containing protein [Bacteroidales bacterium]|jgi:hypothetical protein